MVPIDTSLKHASTSILLYQIISSFAKDTSVFKNCKNGNLFFLLFYTTDFKSSKIFKWQKRSETAFLELAKYEEIAKSLGVIDFIWPMN